MPGPDFSFHPIADARQRRRAAQGALFTESSGELGYGILWGLWRDSIELTPRERAAVARHRARNFALSGSRAELTGFYRTVLRAYNRERLRLVRRKR